MRGLLGLGLLLALPRSAGAAALEPRLSAVLEMQYAVGTRRGRGQKLEAVLEPRLEMEAAAGWNLHALARLRADAYDRLEPGEPTPASVSKISRWWFAGRHMTYELRELTLQGRIGPAYLTLGKQQIVWGEADGLKVLDRVDPMDFREFILDDFEKSRIPLWAVNLEIPMGPAELQLLWQPDPSFDELPERDSVFAFSAPRLLPPRLPGHLPVLEKLRRPRRIGRDGSSGARLSAHLLGWDLSANYLYQYDGRPIFFAARGVSAQGPVVVYTPEYRRTHVVGGTASNSFGDFTLRTELLWQSARYLSTEDPGDTDLVVRTPELASVVGLDWFGIEDTLVSLQVFQSLLLHDRPELLRHQLETVLTLLAQHRMWNERLVLEAIWLHDPRQGDGLVLPKVSYELRDGLNAWFGFDVFYGSRKGLFGQFDGRDRFVVGMQWGF